MKMPKKVFLTFNSYCIVFYISVSLINRAKSDSEIKPIVTTTTTEPAISSSSEPSTTQPRLNVVKEDPTLDVGPLMQITVARGETARLPCIHENLAEDNKIRLVLWYRNDTSRPFISYDARSNENETETFSRFFSSKYSSPDERARKTAIRFSLERDGQTLIIIEVKGTDQAEYRCTMHYSNSPSVTRRLKLIVVDDVQRVQLLDTDGNSVGAHVGPFTEESQLSLTCKAQFSCQLVDIQWQMEGKPLASKWSQPEKGVATSSLLLSLNYNHSLTTLTCRLVCNTTRNGNIDASIVDASTTIIMHFVPKASIFVNSAASEGEDDAYGTKSKSQYRISEGKTLTLYCSVKARPPPYRIAWLHNGRVLSVGERMAVKLNTSLVIAPALKEDSGLYTCLASNSEGDGQSNAVGIKVDHTPYCVGDKQRRIVAIRNKSVTLDCKFTAEPSSMNFSWDFDPPFPKPKPTARYSPKLQIYTPNPVEEDKEQDTWSTFPQLQYKVDKDNPTTSYLTFVPQIDDQSVVCFAKNKIGKSQAPCTFKIKVIEPPDPPSNCEISVLPLSKLKVWCEMPHFHQQHNSSEPSSPGISYVLSPEARTSSHLEVWSKNTLLANLTNDRPSWVVRGLPPNSKIGLRVYIASQYARSSFVDLESKTIGRALSDTASEQSSNDSGTEEEDYSGSFHDVSAAENRINKIYIFVGCLFSGIVVLLLMLFATLFFIRRRSLRRQPKFLTDDGNSTPGTTGSIAETVDLSPENTASKKEEGDEEEDEKEQETIA